jgi:hypothetical protein
MAILGFPITAKDKITRTIRVEKIDEEIPAKT